MIYNWIRKYKEDGYNVINHKKGRPAHEGQRQTDSRASKANKGPQTEELKTYCRERICKKIERLSLTKNQRPTAQEIVSRKRTKQPFNDCLILFIYSLSTGFDKEPKKLISGSLFTRPENVQLHCK